MAQPAADQPAAPVPTDLHADHAGALLLAGGVASLLDVLTAAGQGLAPFWPRSPLLPLVFVVVVLLAFYRHRWTRLYRPFGSRLPIYLAELIMLVLITRLVPLLATPGRLLALLPSWWSDPATVFDAVFVVDAVLVGTAWFLGHIFGSAVDQLHLQPGELAPPRGTPEFAHWERAQAAFDHRGAQRQIATLILSGGLVAIAGLAAAALARPPSGLLAEAVIAAGLYLVCGLLLLGWAQVTLLDTLWRLDDLSVPAGLRRRWPGWLAALLVAVALLALVAPRSYALDPLALLVWLLALAVGLVQVLMFLIMLPFIWLASLLGLGSGSGGAPVGPPPLPPASQPVETDIPFLALLRSLGFWLLTLALAVYAVRTLYQSRWGALRFLPRLALWQALGRLWRALLGGLGARATALAAALRAGAAARSAVAGLGRPPRPPRPTDPAGLIQFLYLSLVERAGRRGYPRRRGMTAAEYSRYLAARLAAAEPPATTAAPPEAADAAAPGPPATALAELDVLTASFMEARYSRRPVGEGEVSRARQALRRLLALMRRATPRR
jgi:hypothetical protein